MTFQELKNEMEKLAGEKHFLIDNMDITGGEKGIRNNNRQWNKIRAIEKRLNTLKRILLRG